MRRKINRYMFNVYVRPIVIDRLGRSPWSDSNLGSLIFYGIWCYIVNHQVNAICEHLYWVYFYLFLISPLHARKDDGYIENMKREGDLWPQTEETQRTNLFRKKMRNYVADNDSSHRKQRNSDINIFKQTWALSPPSWTWVRLSLT